MGSSDPGDASLRGALSTISLEAIRAAARRIEGAVDRTPVLRSAALDRMTGRELWFKAECSQRTGSFKLRGAMNAVLRLTREATPPGSPVGRRSGGVATHSSGNHGRALAHAARVAGIAAHVAMPSDAPAEKLAAVRAEGARLVLCDPSPEARIEAALTLCRETGATFIPPSDHDDVIAGQGTVGLELVAQVPGLDAIVVPVGGGGLLAGVAVAAGSLAAGVRVIGAEPEGADDASRSKVAGRHLPLRAPALTIADGLRAPLVARAWPALRDLVDSVVPISDESIMAALLLLHTHLGLLVEPSAAIALAAVIATPALAGRVGVVLTGGNIDPARLERGLA